mmetsp:Transcript_31499/g.45968  ORF Transcript_31499/g.45968 Transcript_31499/m.45968 type:complete len:450 (-) Transcript_31499:198-1547(-)
MTSSTDFNFKSGRYNAINSEEEFDQGGNNTNNIFSHAESMTKTDDERNTLPRSAMEEESSNDKRNQGKYDIECAGNTVSNVQLSGAERIIHDSEFDQRQNEDENERNLLDNSWERKEERTVESHEMDLHSPASSILSILPEERLPIRYEPSLNESDDMMIKTVLNSAPTNGLLFDAEELIKIPRKENDDDDEGRSIHEGFDMDDFYKEDDNRIMIRVGSRSITLKRDVVHMILLFIASLSLVIMLRLFVVWGKSGANSTDSPSMPTVLGGKEKGEKLNDGMQFSVSESFVQEIRGNNLESMDLKQIHKFQSMMTFYTKLYDNSDDQGGVTDVATRCVLDNQVLSSSSRKRKHQQDGDDKNRRRRLDIFDSSIFQQRTPPAHEEGTELLLEVEFTMTYSSGVDISSNNYPQKFKEYINGEEGKELLLSDLRELGLNADELEDLYSKEDQG